MKPASLKGRSLLTWIDYTPEEIRSLLDLTEKVKREAMKGKRFQRFRGKTLAMIFEKRSTRTRAAFETAFGEEGGHPVFMSSQDLRLGSGESIEDTARVLGTMFDAIMFRGFSQEHARILAKYACVPVYNGLTDEFHPTQVLSDIFTLEEEFGACAGRKICFAGDGRNNVARSLLAICARLGIHCSIAAPAELQPDPAFLDIVHPIARDSGARIEVTDSLSAGVAGADAVYTDVWASMGEEMLRGSRSVQLAGYRVDSSVMEATGKPDSVFMHCLPANKGEEVTLDVIEGPRSRVFLQSENRKHTVKAIMLATIP